MEANSASQRDQLQLSDRFRTFNLNVKNVPASITSKYRSKSLNEGDRGRNSDQSSDYSHRSSTLSISSAMSQNYPIAFEHDESGKVAAARKLNFKSTPALEKKTIGDIYSLHATQFCFTSDPAVEGKYDKSGNSADENVPLKQWGHALIAEVWASGKNNGLVIGCGDNKASSSQQESKLGLGASDMDGILKNLFAKYKEQKEVVYVKANDIFSLRLVLGDLTFHPHQDGFTKVIVPILDGPTPKPGEISRGHWTLGLFVRPSQQAYLFDSLWKEGENSKFEEVLDMLDTQLGHEFRKVDKATCNDMMALQDPKKENNCGYRVLVMVKYVLDGMVGKPSFDMKKMQEYFKSL